MNAKWYEIEGVDQIDTPSLLIYPERINQNISVIINRLAGQKHRLRPHVKTHKMKEISELLMTHGIGQFKCATIAEADMLGLCKAPDVLLAYQPVGPKIDRFINLIQAYPNTHYSCLIDDIKTAKTIDTKAQMANLEISIYIDIDVGMGRTGVAPNKAKKLIDFILETPNLRLKGLHGYDGHIDSKNPITRQQEADKCYKKLKTIQLEYAIKFPLELVMGGSPSFESHANRTDVVCSPGTFIFWDWGYHSLLPKEKFVYGALVLTRIISIIDQNHLCLDLGYKSIASESPFPRLSFFDMDILETIMQSEEHMVVEVKNSSKFEVGMELYAVPKHICPTVALYEEAVVIVGNKAIDTWKIIARDRKINY